MPVGNSDWNEPVSGWTTGLFGASKDGATRATLLIVWTLFFAWCLRPIWGIDIFSHVVIGRECLSHGIPTADIFSSAYPDAPWVPFQVGYEVLVAFIDSWFGLDGLRVAHAILLASAFTAAFRSFRRVTGSPIASVFLLILLAALFEERIRLRPHVFNLLFETLFLLPLALGAWRSDPRRWLWGVSMLALIWATFHAMGVIWLFAVLGTYLVLGDSGRERRWALLTLMVSVLMLLPAPGAVRGILHVLSIQGQWVQFVPELAPSWAWFSQGTVLGVVAGVAPWLALVALIVVAFSKPERARWPVWLCAAGFTFGAMLMVRLGYYSVFVLLLLWPELSALFTEKWPGKEVLCRRAAMGLSIVLLSIVVIHLSARWSRAQPWTTTLQPGFFPEEETSTLKQAGIQGRVFNETEWGGYLLYHLYPDMTVLSDGRITFAADVAALLQADMKPSERVQVAETAHERYGIDLLIRRRGVFPENKNWVLLLRGPTADVWSRADRVTFDRLGALEKVLSKKKKPDVQKHQSTAP